MASTWSRILEELKEEQKHETPGGRAAWSKVLYRKITRLVEITKRPLVIYGTACTHPKKLTGRQISIDASDKIGFHEVLERVDGPNLDIIIHSPGGAPEAAETIVEEVRRKYSSVRFIVPAYAKSAATMMVMSADQIILDEDAELGPIDPQMILPTGVAPAEAIKEQFEKASKDLQQDPKKITVWMPILQPMGPSLLVQCDHAIALSKQLVEEWLTKYMFKGESTGPVRAKAVADYLSKHANFDSHARRVKLEQLEDPRLGFGLNLLNLRSDPALLERIWEIYCVMDVMFANSPVYKLFYNSMDDAMVRMEGVAELLLQQPGGKQLGSKPSALPLPKI